MTTGKLSPANSKNLINLTLNAGGGSSKAPLVFLPSCSPPFERNNVTAGIRNFCITRKYLTGTPSTSVLVTN
jgi:hypothetical protein